MTSKISKTLINMHDLSVGAFYFYKNYVVAEIKEGIAMTYENALEILELGRKYYGKTTPFVYISNRVNSYSFNPTSHFKTTAQFPNLVGFASVTYDRINEDIAKLEQAFFSKPTANFNTLEDAIHWAEELIPMD